MTVLSLTKITPGPRHILKGKDKAGNLVQFAVTEEQRQRLDKNDAKDWDGVPISYEEWNSGEPTFVNGKQIGGIGRYVLVGECRNPDQTTWVLPGEVCEEATKYLIGLPPKDAFIALSIDKTDLSDAADFTSLKDSSALSSKGITLTATEITII